MWGNRPCGEQLSGVPRKQGGMPKYPLQPGKECQAADGRLPQKAAPPKERALFRVLFLLDRPVSLDRLERKLLIWTKKEPGTRIASRLSLVAKMVSLDRHLQRPAKREGACVGGTVGSLPHVERSVSERITPPQRSASCGSRSPPKEKAPFRVLFLLVEAGGIEPPSENTSTQVSPSAVCLLGFPSRIAGKQAMRYGIL